VASQRFVASRFTRPKKRSTPRDAFGGLDGVSDDLPDGLDGTHGGAAERLGKRLGLAHRVQLFKRRDLRDANLQHLATVGLEGPEIQAQGIPSEHAIRPHRLIHLKPLAFQQLSRG
jgi:hypothetical protein